MARGMIREPQQNGEPPPSTLAAQLVNHLTNGKKHSRNQDQETFRQLLREVIGAEGQQSSQSRLGEVDGELNYKLIHVIIKAGLEPLSQDDPFDEQGEMLKQVRDSLEAVDCTLRRNPEVLFIDAFSQGPGPNFQGPLFLWLIPKLLVVTGQTTEYRVRRTVSRLMRTLISIARKPHFTSSKRFPAMKYLKGCINDLLCYLELPNSTPAVHHETPRIDVPSASTIEEVCPNYRDPNSLQIIIRASSKSRQQVLRMTTYLLALSTSALQKLQDSRGPADTMNFEHGWVLSSLTRFWPAIAPSGKRLDQDQSQHSSLASYLDCLRSFCAYVITIGNVWAIGDRFVALLTKAVIVILEIEMLPLPPSIEIALCFNLVQIAGFRRDCRNTQSIHQRFVEHLLPDLSSVQADLARFQRYAADLQQSIALATRCCQTSNQPMPPLPSFQSPDLENFCRECFDKVIIESASEDSPRPHKRVRLADAEMDHADFDPRAHIIIRIHRLLGVRNKAKLTCLSEITAGRCSKFSEQEQCSLYSWLGLVACVNTRDIADVSPGDNNRQIRCESCDGDVKRKVAATTLGDSESEEAFSAIAHMIEFPRTQKYRRPRVAAILALRRLLSHTSNPDHLNLTASSFGQWCLQGLHSSVRELRIAAGRTLPVFLDGIANRSILQKNRLAALDYLRVLSEQSGVTLQETCILVWGQVARVSSGDEMNLVLLRLVEYLGNTNPLICGLAYDELQRLANHSPFSAMKLFAPYWRTIAVTVVQDLHRRPQIAQQMSDLLAMTVADFLSMTQVYTVPFFVLTKKQDVLQRIADACGQSIMVLCREHNNLAAILSCVLLRSPSDAESLVMTLLNAVSPEFKHVNCAELLKSEPQATASELLRAAGENDESKKPKAHQALHLLAGVTHGKPTSSRSTARRTDVIGSFFETHVLGIMALLADTINEGRGPQPTLEKVRCLGAIREMINLAKGHISNGLPQICACLRSAIENTDLSDQAFDAWIIMMCSLGEDEIATLVDPTFAILVQYWDTFSPDVQTRAYDMISYIVKAHSSMMRDIVHTLPSLASIPLMAKFEEDLAKLKAQMDIKHHFQAFSQRCQNENPNVVLRALDELSGYLVRHQDFLHESANSEQPDAVVAQLTRSILDASVHFSNTHPGISVLCAKCMGLVGCMDPTRIEAIREKREILVLSNFARADEVNDFVIFFFREVLVKAFLSATNSRSQGFLAYAMQELLSISDIRESVKPRSRDEPFDANYRRWVSLPESVRTTLMPFTDSKYFVTAGISQPPCVYPLYKAEMGHSQWLRTFTFDLLRKTGGVGKVQTIFSVLSRIVRFQDISISNFLLPFACLNVIVNGTDSEKVEISQELLLVLHQPLPDRTSSRDNIILSSQTVFQVLDYLSRWMQEKKKEVANFRSPGTRAGRSPPEAELERGALQISSVDAILATIPADVISRRAVECKSFSRALFHWEQFIREQKEQRRAASRSVNLEALYERLQEIYTQIDEPDGIEGISSHLQVLNIDQQILEHRKAGRWTAAQSWYELQLTEKPYDLDVQHNLLTSLKESGLHDVLLNQVDGFRHTKASNALSLPFAVEASWVTGKWGKLKEYLSLPTESLEGNFNVGVGRALLALIEDRPNQFSDVLDQLRRDTARTLSNTNTTSFQGCHDALLKFHVLTEMEMITGVSITDKAKKISLRTSLHLRLDALGPFFSDKQYILGLRRAVMQLSRRGFSRIDIASAWLTSAKLARKGNFIHQAFNAVLHASQLGDNSATIEHSRLLWREGNHRKAIQSLEGAISADAFRSHDYLEADESVTTNNLGGQTQQNLLTARAHLLLAKWIDRAGQTQSDVIIHQYKDAVDHHLRWEKGHYYLGKHYNKLLESEKAKPLGKQAQPFITGETAKLVVENYLRSLAFGAKYIYQTLPRLLTLWLDMGAVAEQPLDPRYGNEETFRSHVLLQRKRLLTACNSQVKKYIDRLPAFVFYTALSQMVARICHPSQAVYVLILEMVAKVVHNHTAQALWTLLAVMKSSSADRGKRGVACMTKVLELARKQRADTTGSDVKAFIAQAQKLTDQLLHVCEGNIDGKPSHISLLRDLGFNHKTASCKLAIPLELSLTASLPTVTDNVNMRQHKAFNGRDYIHISSFLDDVLVLNSLQKPRKISIRGSDGHVYALLCKPKDDLRKDQRLMEFNAMINRALKKDAESSKRRLYIKTYAVTPLNEECGLIEWVDNLKTLREILLAIYKQKNVPINYAEIRALLNESITTPDKLPIFTDKVLSHFQPVFHEWFVGMFPEPGSWFTARLRYTRSCAVMSIVGHVLGLGDRHGENILFEEGNGGTFHVDFNCLFDKGLTFEKPELVPFRLTHNMVDAFGAYGFEGPFRKSCELTLGILRQNEDTLMTILETFLYDPTTDFIGKKKKVISVVPDTPEGVLESVNSKVKGLLPGESVPLSVEGYVQALIQQATDPFKLASMYIGWCAFF